MPTSFGLGENGKEKGSVIEEWGLSGSAKCGKLVRVFLPRYFSVPVIIRVLRQIARIILPDCGIRRAGRIRTAGGRRGGPFRSLLPGLGKKGHFLLLTFPSLRYYTKT